MLKELPQPYLGKKLNIFCTVYDPDFYEICFHIVLFHIHIINMKIDDYNSVWKASLVYILYLNIKLKHPSKVPTAN